MTEPTPKPTDALESLREIRQFIGEPAWGPKLSACIAAWEKERAMNRSAMQMWVDDEAQRNAALERIEGEMRAWPGSITEEYAPPDLAGWADELRAAREGGK